jgi:hypothetical protein
MTPASDPIRAFTVAILEQAIIDYVTLRELGFVTGKDVNRAKLDRILAVNPRYSPTGYFSAREIEELVWFLASDQFVRLCTLVGEADRPWPATAIRRAIGLTEGAEYLVGTDDLWWIITPRHMRARQMVAARDPILVDLDPTCAAHDDAHDDDDDRAAA